MMTEVDANAMIRALVSFTRDPERGRDRENRRTQKFRRARQKSHKSCKRE